MVEESQTLGKELGRLKAHWSDGLWRRSTAKEPGRNLISLFMTCFLYISCFSGTTTIEEKRFFGAHRPKHGATRFAAHSHRFLRIAPCLKGNMSTYPHQAANAVPYPGGDLDTHDTSPPPLPPWVKGFLVTSKGASDKRRAGEEVVK